MSEEQYRWTGLQTMPPMQFRCGYCGWNVSSVAGYTSKRQLSNDFGPMVYICPNCTRPTCFVNTEQVPGVAFGDDVDGIDDPLVAAMHAEARQCVAASAFTASVLACRKLLMHLAVAKGAKENDKFAAYVEYLAAKGYVPPDAKEWVDHIRQRSNEANHDIVVMKREDAEELISFSGMLLQLVYEFPAVMRKKTAAKK